MSEADSSMIMANIEKAGTFLRSVMEWGTAKPQTAIVLGSGLGSFAEILKTKPSGQAIPYQSIPHFPCSTVEGHKGELVCGTLEGQNPILIMNGRIHRYEGYTAQEVVFPIRVLRSLGIRQVILTNSAGAIGDHLFPGDLMLITDHINLTGDNPLLGANLAGLGPRFVDMQGAYCPSLRAIAQEAATEMALSLGEGIYLGVIGPTYETPAEVRMFKSLGADAVGMSTVLENIAARHAGMSVLGISCMTNKAAGLSNQKITHEEVGLVAGQSAERFQELLSRILARIHSH